LSADYNNTTSYNMTLPTGAASSVGQSMVNNEGKLYWEYNGISSAVFMPYPNTGVNLPSNTNTNVFNSYNYDIYGNGSSHNNGQIPSSSNSTVKYNLFCSWNLNLINNTNLNGCNVLISVYAANGSTTYPISSGTYYLPYSSNSSIIAPCNGSGLTYIPLPQGTFFNLLCDIYNYQTGTVQLVIGPEGSPNYFKLSMIVDNNYASSLFQIV
jgi:hypothetical protein